jgi:hypothetical protein
MALNNQDLVLERLSVLQLAERSRRERGLEDGLQVPAHERAATSGHMPALYDVYAPLLHQPTQLASNGTPPPQAKAHAQIIGRLDGEMADQPRKQEARIRSGFVKNDLVQVWNRDQTSKHQSPQDQLFACMRMRSSDEGNGQRNLQEGTNVLASTQSWHTSTQSTPQIHVPACGNEAGASGEDNTLLSD